MVLVYDVLTPELTFVSSFIRLMFETSIVEGINSGQINLVATCIDDCACHHLTIPDNCRDLAIANVAQLNCLSLSESIL